jgi:hypothetical protein
MLGKISKKVIIRGKCEVCNSPLNRFCSDRKIKELMFEGIINLNQNASQKLNGQSKNSNEIIKESHIPDQLELWN